MAKQTKTTRVLRSLRSQDHKVTPIATDMILPNHSGATRTPSLSKDIANKKYVDDGDLWEVDGTETQLKTADEIDMQSKKILNVTDPTLDQDAATKKYVDDNDFWARTGTVLTTKTAKMLNCKFF